MIFTPENIIHDNDIYSREHYPVVMYRGKKRKPLVGIG